MIFDLTDGKINGKSKQIWEAFMDQENQTPHKRRVRYKGKYPKKFAAAGEVSGHDPARDSEGKYTSGHAYFHYGAGDSGLFADPAGAGRI